MVIAGPGAPDRLGAGWSADAALLADLAVPAVVVDPGGRIAALNTAASLRFEPATEGDLLVAALAPDEHRPGWEQVLERLVAGERWAGELPVRTAGGGDVRAASVTAAPLRPEGALLLLEVPGSAPDDARSTRSTRRLARLATVTSDLLAAASLDEVVVAVVQHMVDAAGATVGSISLLVDDETLALVGTRGVAEEVEQQWATYPLDGQHPVRDALRGGEVLVLRGREEWARRYPDVSVSAGGERTMVVLPLMVGERPLGAVSLSYPSDREVDRAERIFLRQLADTCAMTVDRIQAQEAAADREAKLRLLSEASERFGQDLDVEATLVAVAEAAVPWFADWCAISLAEDGVLRTLAVAHAKPEHEATVQELQERYPATPDDQGGAYEVLRTGVSQLVPDVTDEVLVQSAKDEEHLRLLRALQFRSGMSCALAARGRTLGVITWVTGEGGRRFGPEDLAFAEDIARRAGTAIDNAQLHSEVRDAALTLQRAVLPTSLPTEAGWSVAVDYSPAGRTEAGGDFYDVVPLGEGRLAVFVGDVMGRGVKATSTMAQLRSAVRTLVALDPSPRAVSEGLDLVFDRLGLDGIVTLAYAVADPAADALAVVNAGHPPLLVQRGDGSVEKVIGERVLLLGAGGGDRDVVTVPFGPGDSLLLCTDGLVERRGEDLEAGLARLEAALRDRPVPSPADDDLDGWLTGLVARVGDPSGDDDVAVLVARRLDVPAPGGGAPPVADPRTGAVADAHVHEHAPAEPVSLGAGPAADRVTARMELPASPRSAAAARRLVGDLCRAADVDEGTRDVAVLLVSELVTNAIRYGGDHAVVDAAAGPDLLRVSVRDQAPERPVEDLRPADDAESGRGVMLVEALSSRWGTDPSGEGGKSVWFELDLDPERVADG